MSAPVEPEVIDTGQCGTSCLVHTIAAKCADRNPTYRMGLELTRCGLPRASSTRNERLNRGVASPAPVFTRLREFIRQWELGKADDTRLGSQKDARGKGKSGVVWTFRAGDSRGGFDMAYQMWNSRAGLSSKALLEGTTDALHIEG